MRTYAHCVPRTVAAHDLSLSRIELGLLAIQFGLTFLLQLTPVLRGVVGQILLPLMACLAWLSPVSGFFFIAAGQALPYPEGAVFNPAQIGFITFPIAMVLRYKSFNFRGLNLLGIFLVWAFWYALVDRGFLTFFHPNSDYMKSLYYAAMACYLVNMSGGRYAKCLLGLCLGGLSVVTAFWGHKLGFPIILSGFGGMRGEFSRLGGVRADSVMVWPPLLMSMFGILGMALVVQSTGHSPRVSRRIVILALGTVVLGVIPLVATMTHGAIGGFVVMSLAFMLAYGLQVQRGQIKVAVRRQFKRVFFAVILMLATLLVADAFEMRSRLFALKGVYEDQSERMGVAASRTEVWQASVKNIVQYPLFGIHFSGGEIIPVSQYGTDYVAHNVFLDAGRGSGIPGIILLWLFFWKPAARMWRSGQRLTYLPYLMAHFAMFIFWMTLSFVYYKTFWALWMLMAMAASQISQRRCRPEVHFTTDDPRASPSNDVPVTPM